LVSRLFATIRSELGEVGLAADQDESRVASSRHADDTNPRRVDHPPEDGMRDHGIEHSLDVARSAEELGVGSIRARVLEVVAWVHGRRDDEAVPGQIDCRVVMTEVGPAGAVRDHDEWVSTRLRLAIDRHIEVEWPQFDERRRRCRRIPHDRLDCSATHRVRHRQAREPGLARGWGLGGGDRREQE